MSKVLVALFDIIGYYLYLVYGLEEAEYLAKSGRAEILLINAVLDMHFSNLD